MASFLVELRRRNVFKVAVAYAIVGWLLVEVASTVFPILQIPEWAVALVTMLLLLGFPVAIVLSWAYEVTPEGIKKTRHVPLEESVTHLTGRKLDFVIIGVLVLALGFVGVDHYVLETPEPDQETVAEENIATQPAGVAQERREVLPSSVAVLPLDNLSPDPDNAYFAAGMHEEILNQLAKLHNLNVISRTSVLRYAENRPPIPEIAAELNVQAVMEGSVRFDGERVLVQAQLIDAATDSHLWSDRYERELAGVFAIQADIAMNIANALEAEFSPDEQERIEAIPTDSPAAYALYLRALSAPGGVDATRRAIQDLDNAIDLDPDFALAHALRAWAYAGGLLFSVEVPVEEYEQNAIASAEQALALDPSIGLAHSALAAIADVNWRWAEARRHAELAYELSPNDTNVLFQYVRFMRSAGEYHESIRANERWSQLDPTVAGLYQQLAVTHRYARNYAAAAAAARKAIEIAPASGSYHVHLAYAEAARGNRDEALRELRIAEQLFGGNFDQVFRVGQMAMAYSQLGRREDAERMLTLLETLDRRSPVGEAVWALAYLALEDYDEAYEQLESAMQHPSPRNNTTLIEIKANPWSIPELDTPRFREVLSGLWSVE